MDKTKFFSSKEACKILGVHPKTLYLWEKKGSIETMRNTPTGKRFYNVDKYLQSQENETKNEEFKEEIKEEIKNQKIDKKKYLSGKETCKILGIHPRTLYVWEKKGAIETVRNTPSSKRFYNVEKYLNSKGLCNIKEENTKESNLNCCKLEELDKLSKLGKVKICYARVSSNTQKEELIKQKEILKKMYPEYTLVEDIGSGINLAKDGLLKIIEIAISGNLSELVIVHKDRLAKIGYELIEFIVKKYSNGIITTINKKEEIEPEEEMVNDVVHIMNIITNKINERRKHHVKNK